MSFSKSFVYFIHRVVVYNFPSIFVCIWHPLLSHNVIHFQYLFLHINLIFTSQRFLVFLCCWCIWLSEKLFQTWKTFLILPMGIIWDSVNLLSTEAHFCSWSQIFNSLIYSMHDWRCQKFGSVDRNHGYLYNKILSLVLGRYRVPHAEVNGTK